MDISGDPALVVDRVIPFGLALVEAISAALAAHAEAVVSVSVRDVNDGELLLRISTSADQPVHAPTPKIMSGLAAQLGAVQSSQSPGDILCWRFKI